MWITYNWTNPGVHSLGGDLSHSCPLPLPRRDMLPQCYVWTKLKNHDHISMSDVAIYVLQSTDWIIMMINAFLKKQTFRCCPWNKIFRLMSDDDQRKTCSYVVCGFKCSKKLMFRCCTWMKMLRSYQRIECSDVVH